MNKTGKIIISVVGFLVLAAGIVAGTYLVQKNQDIREKAAPSTNLSFFPSVVTKSAGQTFDLTINADTGENKLTGIDVEIAYDPNVIELVSVTPTSSIVSLSTVIKDGTPNNTTGLARFAVFTVMKTDAVSGNLDIINISGKVKAGAANGQYPITFTQTTTMAAVDEGLSVVVNTTPANVTVSSTGSSGATATATSTATRTPSPTPTTAGGVGGAQITLPTATATTKSATAAATATTKATVTSSSATAKPAAATTPPDLPVTGVSLPFVGGIVLGMGAIIASLFLAF